MHYQRQMLEERSPYYQVSVCEIEDTISRLNKLLRNSKLKKAETDFRIIKALIGISILSFFAAVFLGAFVHFGFAIAFTVVFFGSISYVFYRSGRGDKDQALVEA